LIEACFEYSVPPPTAFLRWLLRNPRKLEWPTNTKGVRRTFKKATQDRRSSLVDGDGRQRAAVQEEALAELKVKGVRGSRGKWWAFEGFTEVDYALMTDRLLLFVEGKRTEPISSSTDWYPRRSQLVRNLEAARESADGRIAALLLITEEPVKELDDQTVEASLPHLEDEWTAVMGAYLGQTTWCALGDALDVPCGNLPDTKHDALRLLEAQGRVVGPLQSELRRGLPDEGLRGSP
jgi:hypothetical protein